ncbi:hypothetical protein PINS_up005747 [Pythium insidiosum]|nr:hypothetical protein PINS_up005747 [Pythium insidiosum]
MPVTFQFSFIETLAGSNVFPASDTASLLPNNALVLGVHWGAGRTLERFGKLVEVHRRAVDTPATGRVRIRRDQKLRIGRRALLTPLLSERCEEDLVVLSFVLTCAFARLGLVQLIGLVREMDATVVRNVLAQREVAVHVADVCTVRTIHRETRVLGSQALRSLLEVCRHAWRPPLAQRAVGVVVSALIIEAMGQLMAHDHTNARVIGSSREGLGAVEWRLQDGSREHHLVGARLIVSIDRRRKHIPTLAINRLADVLNLAGGCELHQ